MHRIFKEALEDATGESRRIIVVFVDIRDFSRFSQQCDSVDVAAFLRKVYMKIIDSYFDFASFYKSTGDGLLLTIPWEDKSLQQISQQVIESCIKCHSEFGTLFGDDPSINFKVPHEIGIGVARGSACCLVSRDKTIDYSGRLVNLASRLTEIARPSGIVIDGAFVIDLLPEEGRKIFEEDTVYIRGIAETEPIEIYYTPEFTVISKYNKQPIVSKRWHEQVDATQLSVIKKFDLFEYGLDSEPLSPDEIIVNIRHSKVINGEVDTEYYTTYDFHGFEYKLERGKPIIEVNFSQLSNRLQKEGATDDMKVRLTIAYIEK